MMDPMARMLAKSEIHDVLMRYARGVDRHDYELVRSCYFEEAVDDHGDYCGPRDKFIEFLKFAAKSLARVTHFMGNFLVEFASDEVAVVESYFLCNIRLASDGVDAQKMLSPGSAPGSSSTILVQGRYIDRFEKRNGTWLIAGRKLAYDCSAAGLIESPASSQWTYGRQDAQDPVFVARAAAGLK